MENVECSWVLVIIQQERVGNAKQLPPILAEQKTIAPWELKHEFRVVTFVPQ
jgi:hypothetical protein